MLTRRQLLTRGTTLLVLTPILGPVLAACSSDDTSSSASAGGGADASSGGSCAGTDSTSTVSEGHTHTVCVLTTDLSNPPANGMTYTSSDVDGHTHNIMLTMAQLASINSGTQVTVTSTAAADGHTHDWSIAKM
jgi:hypothetical protein